MPTMKIQIRNSRRNRLKVSCQRARTKLKRSTKPRKRSKPDHVDSIDSIMPPELNVLLMALIS
jgi:hypothetical protein